MSRLNVFRDYHGAFQLVGSLHGTADSVLFSYAQNYLSLKGSIAISLSLPLQEEPFTPRQTAAFFEGLLPEGMMRSAFDQAAHADISGYARTLARLNDESVGALVFSTEPVLDRSRMAYRVVETSELASFARKPRTTAVKMNLANRLSLAGAQAKIGLYHDAQQKMWLAPEGAAPSNCILKADDGTFPNQVVNEALCLELARLCGFETARYELLDLGSGQCVLALDRFDRFVSPDGDMLDGHALPWRLHQEDFCQAAGFLSAFKYEPTDGHYLSLGGNIIARSSDNPFGDRVAFFRSVLLDYLVGNCDNHLKNYSILWDSNWQNPGLSPRYDIVCTTLYPEIDREMGISLCPSRRIDDVTGKDIRKMGVELGIPEDFAWQLYLDLRDEFREALPQARDAVVSQGFDEARRIALFIEDDAAPRCALR